MNCKIKKMVEDGFAIKRIANILKIEESTIKTIIKENNFSLLKENFTDDKIDIICDLYKEGVSAKQLGIKFSIDKRKVQKWAANRNILRDKNNCHRFTEFNQNVFDTIDNNEKAYWLGFFYADSYNCNTTNTVSLSLQVLDKIHLEKLCNFIGLPINKIKYTKNKEEYEYYTLKMYSKHMCETLSKKGCPQNKSFIIKFPEWLDQKFQISFIRGMFDGDGSLAHRSNNEWKWSLATTKECGESIQNIILKELGLIVNLSYISKTNNNTYELETNGNEKVLKLSEWLYNSSTYNTRLNRKYEKLLELQSQQNNRKFVKDNYKVSSELKNQIKTESNDISIIDLAKKHNLHERTIRKIKSNPLEQISLYEQIVKINNQPITAKYVKTLDYNQRLELVEPLFNYFRNLGWIYPDNTSNLSKEYDKLCKYNIDLNNNELFNNSSLATNICKHFCHKFYDATENKALTMKEVFNNDEKLKILIKNRLGLDWWNKEDNDETFNISFRMLIQGMRSKRLVPSISMFKPAIAKYMYMKYSNEGDTVYDYSVGWGGRLLGAASCNRKYIGVDPFTTDEVQKIIDFLSLKDVKLINIGSENFKNTENSIDFSFSSPPYFDQEVYSKDLSQAYNNGEYYFYNIYWKNTLNNIKHMLKPNKYFGLNITDNYPKMLEIAKNTFGDVVEIVKLRTIRSHLNKSAGIEKYEPIYMFKNNK